jgi:uncharacterized membrane protein required for colicin V production
MLWLAVLMLCVFFAGIAMTVNEGLWSNTISLFSILIASLLAWDWGRVLGSYVIEQVQPSSQNEWAFWFASVWGVFFFSVMLVRILADRISRVRMKFIPQLDRAAGVLMGVVVAWCFAGFASYSLLIPLQARVWKLEEASGWQQQVIANLARPVYTAGKAVYGDDFPELTGG